MGNILNRALSYIPTATALAAVAIAVAGCAAANNATSASSQGEQPYRTAYGISSEGTTTDLYTELFGARQPPPGPAANVASAQPVTAQPVTPAPQNTAPPRPAQTTAANRAPQPAYGQPAAVQSPPIQVAQQPAPPPQEPDVPTAYGIATNGPTTDLYTAIFGPRHSNGQ